MRIGMVGLGRMGANMTKRLLRAGNEVIAHARHEESIAAAEADGAVGARSLEEVVEKLPPRRAVWLMVPAGDATETTIERLGELLEPGDVIVDGGNSRYLDSIRRAKMLAAKDIAFIDCGTSGGIWGLDNGYCLMVGGPRPIPLRASEPIFDTLAPEQGYAHVGPVGGRALHEDGAQRDRVRIDAGLRRRLRAARTRASSISTWVRSQSCGSTAASSARGSRSGRAAPSRTIPVSPRPLRLHRGLRRRADGPSTNAIEQRRSRADDRDSPCSLASLPARTRPSQAR